VREAPGDSVGQVAGNCFERVYCWQLTTGSRCLKTTSPSHRRIVKLRMPAISRWKNLAVALICRKGSIGTRCFVHGNQPDCAESKRSNVSIQPRNSQGESAPSPLRSMLRNQTGSTSTRVGAIWGHVPKPIPAKENRLAILQDELSIGGAILDSDAAISVQIPRQEPRAIRPVSTRSWMHSTSAPWC
jgi:hypothetical protein